MSSFKLDPSAWSTGPDDEEIREHVAYCADRDAVRKRLNIFETDDGWYVEATIPTAGAFVSVSETFKIADWTASPSGLDDIFDDLEDRMIWESGIGLSVELTESES